MQGNQDNAATQAQQPRAEQSSAEQSSADEYPEELSPSQREERRDDNTIYIGRKSVSVYALAVVTQFNQGRPIVKLKARGRSISHAVDVTQVVMHRFIPTLKIGEIKITTEELPSEDGRMNKVSSMEIELSK